MDTVLPFGLRSAPEIFSAVANALEWILWQASVTSIMHYDNGREADKMREQPSINTTNLCLAMSATKGGKNGRL